MTDYIDIKENNNNDIWNIKSDGYYCKKVIAQMVEDGMPEDATDNIVENGVRILGQCPNPNIKGKEFKTGIIIGKVQSGKTSNFISTLALAFDNGYKIAVVLGGNKLNLTQQNTDRIISAFNVDANKLVVLDTKANSSLINADSIKQFVSRGKQVIIVGLKHPSHINNIKSIFENTVLSVYPTIVVDDEGDQATLNTKSYKKKMSSTYAAVLELLNCINKSCFLSITATPQANILIDTCDMLSPDFGELVYPGYAYCGLEEFHGVNQDKYCKVIKEDEVPLIGDEGTPASLYYALADFFVGGAIRRYRGDNKNHAMLIHPSARVTEQKIVAKKVDNILKQWKTQASIKLGGIEDVSCKTLRQQLVDSYNRFKKDGVQVPDFVQLEKYCLDMIVDCSEVLQCNSDENASENAKFWSTNIFVGGNMVERGITIKGLAVTYITRRAKGTSNVDNTEQRARWFGYKKDFLDVCRIWMPERIKEDFSKILEHDDDLWSTIETNQNRGIPFKDIPRVFKLNDNLLRLTRTNVARTRSLSVSEWTAQKKFAIDKQVAINNTSIIEDYRKELHADYECLQYSSLNKNTIYKDVLYDDLYDKVLSKMCYYQDEKTNDQFFSMIKFLFEKLGIKNSTVDIMWMRDGVGQERAINPDNDIIQIFQGRYKNQNSKNYYPGDRAMSTMRKDKMQLQIHYVKPSNREDIDYYCPAFALYVPIDLANKLSQFVTNDGGVK